MITTPSTKILSLAAQVGKVKILKTLLRPAYVYYLNFIRSNRKKAFDKNGVKVLKEFDAVMNSIGIPYSVFAGTLLGAVREKGFIKHDLDIDTMIFNSDYSDKIQKELENKGFRLHHYYLIDDGTKGREETYVKDDVSIDIFYIYGDDTFPTYQCDFHELQGCTSHEDSMIKFGYLAARRLEFPVSREVKRVPFENIEVNVIANAQEWLTYRYGDDFMTPDPSFKDKGNNPHIFEWTGVNATMIY